MNLTISLGEGLTILTILGSVTVMLVMLGRWVGHIETKMDLITQRMDSFERRAESIGIRRVR